MAVVDVVVRVAGGHWGAGNGKHGDQGQNSEQPSKKRKTNPKGSDGKTLLCVACGSFRHLLKECPDSYENQEVHLTGEEEKVVLFTQDESELSKFTREAVNCATLDTLCSKTVAGEKWFNIYREALGDRKSEIEGPENNNRVFTFGNQGSLPSLATYTIPGKLAGKLVQLEVDVVKSDIPLLLSKTTMKNAKVKIDTETDMASIFGSEVPLNITSAGHYCVPFLPPKSEEEEVMQIDCQECFATNLLEADTEEKIKAIKKLDRQFAHSPKIHDLLRDAKVKNILEKHQASCEGCIKRKRNPDRPAVALPMARNFNEVVCIDLKIRKGQPILHMIDMWSRLTVSAILERKKPSCVIEEIMRKWMPHYGTMKTILNDNRGRVHQ